MPQNEGKPSTAKAFMAKAFPEALTTDAGSPSVGKDPPKAAAPDPLVGAPPASGPPSAPADLPAPTRRSPLTGHAGPSNGPEAQDPNNGATDATDAGLPLGCIPVVTAAPIPPPLTRPGAPAFGSSTPLPEDPPSGGSVPPNTEMAGAAVLAPASSGPGPGTEPTNAAPHKTGDATTLASGEPPLQLPLPDASAASLMAIGPAGAAGAAGGAREPPSATPKPVPLTAPTPVAQLTPVLVQATRTQGTDHLTIRLAPVELGMVAIRVDRPADGPASVHVSVERPETLRLLQQDQPQLQRALDAAGVATDHRSLILTLAAPPPASPLGASVAGGNGESGRGNAADGGGTSSNGAGGGSADRQRGRGGPYPIPVGSAVASAISERWLRAGVDITA